MFTSEIQINPKHDVSVYTMGYPMRSDALHNADLDTYPDGMPVLKWNLPESMASVDVVLRPKSLDSFVSGLFAVDAMKERGIRVDRLVLPFIPGARQDRLNSSGDYLFTIKSIAKMINERGFDEVLVLDPHSNVAPALIDRARVFPLSEVLKSFYVGYDAIIAPDAGAGHRAQEAADALNSNVKRTKDLQVIQASKVRDVSTGRLSGFSVDVEAGKHYLVVDDICDGGGTFVGLGEQIAAQGATAGLFVTHGIFSKGTDELNKYYKRITTTNSTLFDKHDAEEIGVVERMILS